MHKNSSKSLDDILGFFNGLNLYISNSFQLECFRLQLHAQFYYRLRWINCKAYVSAISYSINNCYRKKKTNHFLFFRILRNSVFEWLENYSWGLLWLLSCSCQKPWLSYTRNSPRGCLGFLFAWKLGLKKKHSKSQEVEITNTLKL